MANFDHAAPPTKRHAISPVVLLTSLLLFVSSTSKYYTTGLPVLGTIRVLLSVLIIWIGSYSVYDSILILKRRGILPLLILIVIYFSASSYFSGSLNVIQDSFLWLNNAVFYVIIFSVFRKATAKEVALLLCVYSIGLILTGVFYTSRYIPVLSAFNFPQVEGSSHQASAQSALLTLIIVLLLRHTAFHRFVRLFGFAMMIAAVVIVIISGARTPALSSAVVLLMWKKGLRWYRYVSVLVVLLLVFASSFADMQWASSRTERLYEALTTRQSSGVSEVEFRTNNVRVAMEAFYQNPLFGIGYGHWQAYSSRMQNITGLVLAMHNGWAGALSELGLVGITIYLMLIYKSCIGVVWKPSYTISQAVQRMGFLGVLSAMVLSIGGDALLQRTTLIFMAISAAGRDYAPVNIVSPRNAEDGNSDS